MNDASQRIEERIDRKVGGAIALHAAPGNMMTIAPANMGELMEFAKMMAVSGECIPAVFRNKPGACLAIALQAFRTGGDPFAVANQAYPVNDRIAYQAQYIHACINMSGMLQKRLRPIYEGQGEAMKCKIIGLIIGEDDPFEYDSPFIRDILVKNSPLWKGDREQQLFYYSSRAWARRYLPEVMLGMNTGGDIESQMLDVTPPPRPTRERLAETASSEPPEDWYDVTDITGELAKFSIATVEDELMRVFHTAQLNGPPAVEDAIENNEPTVNELLKAGEDVIANRLLIEIAQLRGVIAQTRASAAEAGGSPAQTGVIVVDSSDPPEKFEPALAKVKEALAQNPVAQPPVRPLAVVPPNTADTSLSTAGVIPTPPPGDASYVLPMVYDRNDKPAYAFWWEGRVKNRLAMVQSRAEFDAIIHANGENLQKLEGTTLIASKKVLSDLQKSLET